MAKKEVYVSTDVETSGPIPGPYFMLNFGSVALDINGNELGTFTANLHPIGGSDWHPDQAKWWMAQDPDVLHRIRKNAEPPKNVMFRYHQWLKDLPGRPIFVGYPAAFDFLWIYWYLCHYVGESVFSFSALDIKTMAWMAGASEQYSECVKQKMPKVWTDGLPPHTHDALDDAREQGVLFLRVLAERNKLLGSNKGMVIIEADKSATGMKA